MTPAERVVRAATRAYGETVTEVRPLDLTAAAKPGERYVRVRRRRFPTWLAPLAAAAAVIALAISLVIVRNIPARPVPARPGDPAVPRILDRGLPGRRRLGTRRLAGHVAVSVATAVDRLDASAA